MEPDNKNKRKFEDTKVSNNNKRFRRNNNNFSGQNRIFIPDERQHQNGHGSFRAHRTRASYGRRPRFVQEINGRAHRRFSSTGRTRFNNNFADRKMQNEIHRFLSEVNPTNCTDHVKAVSLLRLRPDLVEKILTEKQYWKTFIPALNFALSGKATPQLSSMLVEMILRKNVIKECSKGIKDILEDGSVLDEQESWVRLVIDLLDILKGVNDNKKCTIDLLKSSYGHVANVCNHIKFFLHTVVNSTVLNQLKEKETEFESLLQSKIEHDLKMSESGKDQSEYMKMKSVFPDISDIIGDAPTLSPIKKTGGYESFKEYMHIQYSLLREDFVGPLRDEIRQYREENQRSENMILNKRFNDIRIYEKSRIVSLACDHGLNYVVTIDVSTLRRVNWSTSGRLKYGTLVCLSADNFVTMLVGTICDSIPNARKDGYMHVKFDPSINEQTIRAAMRLTHTMIEAVAYFEAYRHVLLKCKQLTKPELAMSRYIISCEPRVFPPSYLQKFPRPTFDLRSLVDPNIKIAGNNRFKSFMKDDTEVEDQYTGRRFIRRKEKNPNKLHIKDSLISNNDIRSEDCRNPSVNDYDKNCEAESSHVSCDEESVQNVLKDEDLQQLKQVNIIEQELPESVTARFDSSQMQAILSALKSELSIIQGPPGCGKTFVGKEIIKILLNNEKNWRGTIMGSPILVLCYTNHALDQFMEGICDFYNGDILRVGGRSKSLKLKSRNLSNIRSEMRKARSIPDYIYNGKKSERSKLITIKKQQKLVTMKIKILRENIIHEHSLFNEMGSDIAYQFEWKRRVTRLISSFTNRPIESMIHIWLGIEEISRETEYRIEQIGVDQINNMDARKQSHEESDEFPEIYSTSYLSMLDDDFKIDEKDLEKEIDSFTNENVALNIVDIGKKPKCVADRQWQILRWHRLELTKKLQDQLRRQERIHTHNTPGIDIDDLTLQERWMLYNHWVDKKCKKLMDEFDTSVDEYMSTYSCYEEILMMENLYIMKMADVIGMTTTGAAKHGKELYELNPKIIIVEEAAEILESHLVSNISKDCQQLILIGDHQQLRPKPNNYRLEKEFNLDISLFERLILSGMKYTSLSEQHRMRPLIAENIRKIYPAITDHPSVKQYEDVKGIKHNVFFLNHNNMESSTLDTRSHRNPFEASFSIRLARYLIQQGYAPYQVTVLTTYKGQMYDIMKLKRQEELLQGMTVTVVDNFQGEESDIIILSLVRSNGKGRIGFLSKDNRVCVALSRAKLGMYVLGNFDMYKTHLWNKIVSSPTNGSLVLSAIPLTCQNHPNLEPTLVSSAEDFDNVSEGGCKRPCDFIMSCGHKCQKTCHLTDIEHKDVNCKRPCERKCKNGHSCNLNCGEECKCIVNIEIEPPCGHITKIKCYEQDNYKCLKICEKQLECGHICQKLCNDSCNPCIETVILLLPKCGHLITVPCFTDINEVKCTEKCSSPLDCGHVCSEKCYSCFYATNHHNYFSRCIRGHSSSCKEKCNTKLMCGHICPGTCSDCFQGRIHEPCQEKCRHDLICGHRCLGTCNGCLPCQQPCDRFCLHTKCSRKCYEICQTCREPCAWQCKHYSCTKLCGEPCKRPRCEKRCRENLPCGHRCIGLCGEPCIRFCPMCNKTSFEENCYGGRQFPESSFVQLDDCGHAVEYKLLDKYFDVCDEKVNLRQCPICSTPIYNCRRYGQVLNGLHKRMDRMKKNLLFDGHSTFFYDVNIQDTFKESLKALHSANIATLKNYVLSFTNSLPAERNPNGSKEEIQFDNSEMFSNTQCLLDGLEERVTTPSKQWQEDCRHEVYRCCDFMVIKRIYTKEIINLTTEAKTRIMSAKETLLSIMPYNKENRKKTLDIVYFINKQYGTKYELANITFEVSSVDKHRLNSLSKQYCQDSFSEESDWPSEEQSVKGDFDQGDYRSLIIVDECQSEDDTESVDEQVTDFSKQQYDLEITQSECDGLVQSVMSDSKSNSISLKTSSLELAAEVSPPAYDVTDSSSCEDSQIVLALPRKLVMYTVPCPEYYSCDKLPVPVEFKRILMTGSRTGGNGLRQGKRDETYMKYHGQNRTRPRSQTRGNGRTKRKQDEANIKQPGQKRTRSRSQTRDSKSSKRMHEERRIYRDSPKSSKSKHDKEKRRTHSKTRSRREDRRQKDDGARHYHQSSSKRNRAEKSHHPDGRAEDDFQSGNSGSTIIKKAESNFTYKKNEMNTDEINNRVKVNDHKNNSQGKSKGKELEKKRRSTDYCRDSDKHHDKLNENSRKETKKIKEDKFDDVNRQDSYRKADEHGETYLRSTHEFSKLADAASTASCRPTDKHIKDVERSSITSSTETIKGETKPLNLNKAEFSGPMTQNSMKTKTYDDAKDRIITEVKTAHSQSGSKNEAASSSKRKLERRDQPAESFTNKLYAELQQSEINAKQVKGSTVESDTLVTSINESNNWTYSPSGSKAGPSNPQSSYGTGPKRRETLSYKNMFSAEKESKRNIKDITELEEFG